MLKVDDDILIWMKKAYGYSAADLANDPSHDHEEPKGRLESLSSHWLKAKRWSRLQWRVAEQSDRWNCDDLTINH